MKLFTNTSKILLLVVLGNIILALCSENTNTNLLTNQNMSTEKIGLNSGIFLTEKAFKYKTKKSKDQSLYTTSLNANFKNRNEKSSTEAQAHSLNTNSLKNENKGFQLTEAILHQGWIKYFKYSDGAINKPLPKGFVVNQEYSEQKKKYPKYDYNKLNTDGTYDFLRDENYFYLYLFAKTVTIVSSKQDKIAKLVETFTIEEIRNVYEDSKTNKRNGILDYGKFNEGYCLKISTKDIENTVFIICTETESEKDQMISKLRTMKIDDQHQKGIILIANKRAAGIKPETLGSMFNKKSDDEEKTQEEKKQDAKPRDGYWVTLQEWSQCSKKCDGGSSTFHRMCVPPRNGGKPCVGETVITKKCNTKPCPMPEKSDDDPSNVDDPSNNPFGSKKANTVEVRQPIVKVLPFTDRPQRFSLCKVKESDLFMFQDGTDPNKMEDPMFKGKNLQDIGGIKVPCRVVMNTKTLSVYAGDKFETLHMSFTVKKTRFYEYKKKKNCFELNETSKKYITLCPYTAEISSKEFDDWRRDFETFKNRCERSPTGLSEAEQRALDKKIKDKMDEAKNKALAEARTNQQLQRASQTQGDLAVLVKNTQSVAMKAIQKEQNLEDLIKQEAEEKNRLEEERIRKMIEDEKNKKDCVIKAIREKQLETQISEKAKEIQKSINNIKQEAAAQVMMKRNNLKKILNQLNQKAALKRNLLRQELINVKMSIASELGKAYKKGDVNKCADAMGSSSKRINYCVATFPEDFVNLSYCKNTEEFCEFCCGAEFGDLLSNDKETCIQKICQGAKNGKEAVKEKDRWISNPDGNWSYQKKLD